MIMVFDLHVTIGSFPTCGKCGKDMVFVKVIEIEVTTKEKASSFTSMTAVSSDTGAEAKDSAIFVWKCTGCGFILQG